MSASAGSKISLITIDLWRVIKLINDLNPKDKSILTKKNYYLYYNCSIDSNRECNANSMLLPIYIFV